MKRRARRWQTTSVETAIRVGIRLAISNTSRDNYYVSRVFHPPASKSSLREISSPSFSASTFGGVLCPKYQRNIPPPWICCHRRRHRGHLLIFAYLARHHALAAGPTAGQLHSLYRRTTQTYRLSTLLTYCYRTWLLFSRMEPWRSIHTHNINLPMASELDLDTSCYCARTMRHCSRLPARARV